MRDMLQQLLYREKQQSAHFFYKTQRDNGIGRHNQGKKKRSIRIQVQCQVCEWVLEDAEL